MGRFTTDKSLEQAVLLLGGLTKEQIAAVLAPPECPLLINASAGSGKTHVLARRALYLQLYGKIKAPRMRIMSFSTAGARSIGQRTRELARRLQLYQVHSQTFHSFCFGLAREIIGVRGVVKNRSLPRKLQIGDEVLESRDLNEVLIDLYDLVLRDLPASSPRRRSPAAKIWDYTQMLDSVRSGHPQLNHVITEPGDLDSAGFSGSLRLRDGDGELPLAAIGKLLTAYQERLRVARMIDFAGMITETLRALRSDANARTTIQQRFDHLLIDEYQDTSRAQEEILRLILGPTTGLTVVGDNDQTIYTFNGSDVRNILEFADRNAVQWPGRQTQVVSLEDNFRSTAKILAIAGRVIERNTQRIPKHIRPSAIDPPPPRGEYRRRNASVVLAVVPNAECALGAVLLRVKSWLREGVPASSIAILSRINPDTVPEKALLERLRHAFTRFGVPVATDSVNSSHWYGLSKWMLSLATKWPRMPLETIQRDGLPAGVPVPKQIGLNSFHEVLADAIDRGVPTLEDWSMDLRDTMTDRATISPTSRANGLVLKTIHAAKGEEYRRVVVLHLGKGHFPHPKSPDIEEERRLLHVAITRGEEEVLLTGEPGNAFVRELIKAGESDLERFECREPISDGLWGVKTGTTELDLREALGLQDDEEFADFLNDFGEERYRPLGEIPMATERPETSASTPSRPPKTILGKAPVKLSEFEQAILDVLSSRAPQKAITIAATLTRKLGRKITKKDVNPSLYRLMGKRLVESSNYNWSLVEQPEEKFVVPGDVVPTEDQRSLVTLEPSTPLLIRGEAGSGKTLVLVCRVGWLRSKISKGSLLFVTYNQAPAAYVERWLSEIGAQEDVTARTFHRWVQDLAKYAQCPFARWSQSQEREKALEKILDGLRATHGSNHLFRTPISFWSDEVAWLYGQRVLSREDYRSIKRVGRGTAIQVRGNDRDLVWDVFEIYHQRLEQSSQWDYDNAGGLALKCIEKLKEEQRSLPHYDHVVVDEVQDFHKSWLLGLVPCAKESLTLAGDLAQRIYKRSFTWREVGINLTANRSRHLAGSHRTTRQIMEVALHLATNDDLAVDEDYVPPTIPKKEGPKVCRVVRRNWRSAQTVALKRAVELAKGNQSGSIAIAAPFRSKLKTCAGFLRYNGVEALIALGEDLGRATRGVFLTTFHQLKGLEFDHVVLVGLEDSGVPGWVLQNTAPEDEAHEQSYLRRLVYMAMTRGRQSVTIAGGLPFCRFFDGVPAELFEEL